MKLKDKIKTMTAKQRLQLAVDVGYSVGHLRSVSYEIKPCSIELALNLELKLRIPVVKELLPEIYKLLKRAGYAKAT